MYDWAFLRARGICLDWREVVCAKLRFHESGGPPVPYAPLDIDQSRFRFILEMSGGRGAVPRNAEELRQVVHRIDSCLSSVTKNRNQNHPDNVSLGFRFLDNGAEYRREYRPGIRFWRPAYDPHWHRVEELVQCLPTTPQNASRSQLMFRSGQVLFQATEARSRLVPGLPMLEIRMEVHPSVIRVSGDPATMGLTNNRLTSPLLQVSTPDDITSLVMETTSDRTEALSERLDQLRNLWSMLQLYDNRANPSHEHGATNSSHVSGTAANRDTGNNPLRPLVQNGNNVSETSANRGFEGPGGAATNGGNVSRTTPRSGSENVPPPVQVDPDASRVPASSGSENPLPRQAATNSAVLRNPPPRQPEMNGGNVSTRNADNVSGNLPLRRVAMHGGLVFVPNPNNGSGNHPPTQPNADGRHVPVRNANSGSGNPHPSQLASNGGNASGTAVNSRSGNPPPRDPANNVSVSNAHSGSGNPPPGQLAANASVSNARSGSGNPPVGQLAANASVSSVNSGSGNPPVGQRAANAPVSSTNSGSGNPPVGQLAANASVSSANSGSGNPPAGQLAANVSVLSASGGSGNPQPREPAANASVSNASRRSGNPPPREPATNGANAVTKLVFGDAEDHERASLTLRDVIYSTYSQGATDSWEIVTGMLRANQPIRRDGPRAPSSQPPRSQGDPRPWPLEDRHLPVWGHRLPIPHHFQLHLAALLFPNHGHLSIYEAICNRFASPRGKKLSKKIYFTLLFFRQYSPCPFFSLHHED